MAPVCNTPAGARRRPNLSSLPDSHTGNIPAATSQASERCPAV